MTAQSEADLRAAQAEEARQRGVYFAERVPEMEKAAQLRADALQEHWASNERIAAGNVQKGLDIEASKAATAAAAQANQARSQAYLQYIGKPNEAGLTAGEAANLLTTQEDKDALKGAVNKERMQQWGIQHQKAVDDATEQIHAEHLKAVAAGTDQTQAPAGGGFAAGMNAMAQNLGGAAAGTAGVSPDKIKEILANTIGKVPPPPSENDWESAVSGNTRNVNEKKDAYDAWQKSRTALATSQAARQDALTKTIPGYLTLAQSKAADLAKHRANIDSNAAKYEAWKQVYQQGRLDIEKLDEGYKKVNATANMTRAEAYKYAMHNKEAFGDIQQYRRIANSEFNENQKQINHLDTMMNTLHARVTSLAEPYQVALQQIGAGNVNQSVDVGGGSTMTARQVVSLYKSAAHELDGSQPDSLASQSNDLQEQSGRLNQLRYAPGADIVLNGLPPDMPPQPGRAPAPPRIGPSGRAPAASPSVGNTGPPAAGGAVAHDAQGRLYHVVNGHWVPQ